MIMTVVQALNNALQQEMQSDERVLILGEDVGRNGGVFRVTDGLWQKFGEKRVIDTPLAEGAIAGVSIGLAASGFRPVAELQFDGFSYPALDQLVNHAARIRTRSRGRFTCPLVVRFPYSGGIHAPEHHSDSPEAYFVHTPGLKVVIPATPYDAKGLLVSAIRDPDPVVFMEPKRIYRSVKEDVPEDSYTSPLGEARVVKEGSDITLIAYGSMLHAALQAADAVRGRYAAEVIDLRTLSPLDTETVVRSAKKTGRVVVVHEAPRTCGFGAELAAVIEEKALLSLEAPIARVTGYDTVMPLYRLEQFYLPDAQRINRAIETTMSF
ncbi:MAG: alpha-ketoacid dehydrogenase subunit beta [Candidatus Aenigmarchaeota archaeon]|nr:alpha-ketoacid dehydrogenase subunit beta [Candidatus Aenigmarchaeota archaeon]